MSEAYGPDFITVTDEDGNEFELELVDTLEHNGVTYHALFPASQEDEESGEPVDVDADDEEYGLVIMKRTARSCSPPWTATRRSRRFTTSLWSGFSRRRTNNSDFRRVFLLGA